MKYQRWVNHRLNDGSGGDVQGPIPINLMWVAAAAAEETLQGSPLARAWLDLFSAQLSSYDKYWLRWRGDLAESSELRRAYSGLYGRFFARALLQQHLGFTSFISLQRNGLKVGSAVEVERISAGDIPDWIAWSPTHQRHVLAEAKGSLTAKDFLTAGTPNCIMEGKTQFSRIRFLVNGVEHHPLRWVAASRWATDTRPGEPATALWDPPVPDQSFTPEEADRHQAAMHRAWLDSIAPGFGLRTAQDFSDAKRSQLGVAIFAPPGGMAADLRDGSLKMEVPPDVRPDDVDRPVRSQTEEVSRSGSSFDRDGKERNRGIADSSEDEENGTDALETHGLYEHSSVLEPHTGEQTIHSGRYITAAVTRFGIAPVRAQRDLDELLWLQDRIRKGEEATAMLVCIPLGDLKPGKRKIIWNDAAGISQSGGLSVFDLGKVEIDMSDKIS
jgi:hypothetical protein